MALTDYDELAARSFEEPHDADLRAAVLVCADALTEIEDPRGPLITMEHALENAEPRRALELRRAMHEHAMGEGAGLLGAAAPLMAAGRTLSLEWRSGKLYGVTIDARYLPRKSKITVGQLVDNVLKAPAATDLRRLRVRVRIPQDFESISQMLVARSRRPPLEELVIYTSAWPHQMTPTQQRFLGDFYPHLYFVVQLDRTLSLPLTAEVAAPARYIPDVLLCDPPTTPEARTLLGRALSHADRDLRVAALQRVAAIGPAAKVFESLLCTLLQPGIAGPPITGRATSVPHVPIVTALQALGPSQAAHRVLSKVASRPEYYDAETRRAAGSAAAKFRPS
ncbi:MAG: hypothetical protein H0V17_09495 [Deltaproteobacteria bacterium]|nr:hypothetical protein [Deltaproteobacteria bacterium]